MMKNWILMYIIECGDIISHEYQYLMACCICFFAIISDCKVQFAMVLGNFTDKNFADINFATGNFAAGSFAIWIFAANLREIFAERNTNFTNTNQ